jgi:hypothetical protein
MIFVLGLYSVACVISLWLSIKVRFGVAIVASLVIIATNLAVLVSGVPFIWRVYAAPVTVLLAANATRGAFRTADRERSDNEQQERFNRVGYALAGVAVLETALALIGGVAYYAASGSPL